MGKVSKFLRRADKKADNYIEASGLTGLDAEIARLTIKCFAVEGLLSGMAPEIEELWTQRHQPGSI